MVVRFIKEPEECRDDVEHVPAETGVIEVDDHDALITEHDVFWHKVGMDKAVVVGLPAKTRQRGVERISAFEMSLPGVMKHVGILETAGLLEREKIGRTVYCRLNPEPMASAISWLQEMEQFWSGRLDALAEQATVRGNTANGDPAVIHPVIATYPAYQSGFVGLPFLPPVSPRDL